MDGGAERREGLPRTRALHRPKYKIQVGCDRLTADKIFLNVGGRPLIPKMPGLDTVPYLTNVTMMDLDFIPEHLLVIGGSYVGLEFAQVMRRFGSRVTVVEMGPRVVAREDEDVSLEIQRFLADEGIGLRLHAECISVQKESDGLSVGLDCKEGAPREHGTHLLLAVGRVPNTDDLGLDLAGISNRQTRLHRGRRRASHVQPAGLGAGRLQRQGSFHPHCLQRLRDRRRQPALERRPQVHRPDTGIRALYRPAAWPGRSFRERDKREGHQGPGRQAADVQGCARRGEGRNQWLPQDPRRTGLATHPGRRAAWHGSRRVGPLAPGRRVLENAATASFSATCASIRPSASSCRRCWRTCRRSTDLIAHDTDRPRLVTSARPSPVSLATWIRIGEWR